MQSSLNDGKPTNKALQKICNTATICFEYLQLEVTKLGEQKLDCSFHILLKGSLAVLCHKWGQSLQVLLHVSHEALLVKSWLLLKTSDKKIKTSKQDILPHRLHNKSIIANSKARYRNCTSPSVKLPAV